MVVAIVIIETCTRGRVVKTNFDGVKPGRIACGWCQSVGVGDVFAGKPAGGGACALHRDAVLLGDNFAERVEKVREDGVGTVGLFERQPDEGEAQIFLFGGQVVTDQFDCIAEG